MKIAFYIFAGLFVLMAISIAIFRIIKTNRTKGSRDARKPADDIQTILKEIENNDNPKIVAKGFIRLLQSAYMLVHLLLNAGNQYNDQVQSEMFQCSLTEDVVSSLNSLEGKYV